MKISSPAQLANKLDRNISWRKKELTQLKLLADSSSPPNAGVLRRSGITLMYSHWEGFVKDASVYYLKYLSSFEVEVSKLKSCFAAVVLHGHIYVAGQAKKKSVHGQLVELLRSIDGPTTQLARIPTSRVIATRSSLKGDVLREIAATLGIDYAPFALKEQQIINRLVKLRNSIAHGGGLPIDQGDYDTLHSGIIVLMDIYKGAIQDAADDDGHLR